jgi:hypothetical protein
MLIVACAFGVIFLLRDMQILAVPNPRTLALRFAGYAAILITGTVLFITLTGGHPAWTSKRFAVWAIALQLSESALVVLLQRYAAGRYGWIPCVLPAPAFLMSTGVLAFEMQSRLPNLNQTAALEFVGSTWLMVVGSSAAVLCSLNNPWEDRACAREYAMMTACTAVVFVPFWLFA